MITMTQRVLKGKTPEARAAELIDGTKLKDADYRKQLAAGGVKAIQESNDPMIQLALSVDQEARAVRKRYEEEVVAVERANYAKDCAAHCLKRKEPSFIPTRRLLFGFLMAPSRAIRKMASGLRHLRPWGAYTSVLQNSTINSLTTFRPDGLKRKRRLTRRRPLILFPPTTSSAATAAHLQSTAIENWLA